VADAVALVEVNSPLIEAAVSGDSDNAVRATIALPFIMLLGYCFFIAPVVVHLPPVLRV